jgi:hypothetical protein
MLDEIKTIDVQYKDRKITLTPDFRAFKKLHKNTGNAFAVIPPAQSFVRGRFLFSKARTFIPERPR